MATVAPNKIATVRALNSNQGHDTLKSSSSGCMKLPPPAPNDDTYLMKELNQLRAIVSEAPPGIPAAFSVIFQWPSPSSQEGKGNLAVHFHSMAEAATRTATLYDPAVDAETDFLSVRGLQLNLLACLTRSGHGTNPLVASTTSTSTSTSSSSSSSRLLTLTLMVPPSASADCRKYLVSSFERIRKLVKAELIAAKKAEIMKIKGSLAVKPLSTPIHSQSAAVNDENESPVNNSNNSNNASPTPVPTAPGGDRFQWLTALETDEDPAAAQPLSPSPHLLLTSPASSPYNPNRYRPQTAESVNQSAVLQASINVFVPPSSSVDASIKELTEVAQSMSSPGRSPRRQLAPDDQEHSPIQSPARKGMKPLLSTSMVPGVRQSMTEKAMLESLDIGVEEYGLMSYELLKKRALRTAGETDLSTAPLSEPQHSPVAKSLEDFKAFTRKIDEDQTKFAKEMEELEKEKATLSEPPLPTSYSYDVEQGNDRPTYTPRKSAAMADYMMAKHIVETGNGGEAPPTPLSPAPPSSSAAPLSPSREDYSPNKAAMMADYKLARESTDQTLTSTLPTLDPDQSVSEGDIAALKQEMDDLRSQLSGVTNAVKVVAHELSSGVTPTVTQSLPSPSLSADDASKNRWARNPDSPYGVEEPQNVEVVGNVHEEENDDLISAAIEMELNSTSRSQASQHQSQPVLRSSIDTEYSNKSFLSALDDTIPPPPPTPPHQAPQPSIDQSFSNSFGNSNSFSAKTLDFRRSSLDMAAATRDLEEWETAQASSSQLDVKVTGLDLTIKNINFPPNVNASVSAAILPPSLQQAVSSPRRQPQPSHQQHDIKVLTIEEKVKAVMAAASTKQKVSSALGLSVDDRGWKNQLKNSTQQSLSDSTMFSPEPTTQQEKEAKNVRAFVRQADRVEKEQLERKAMEDRRAAFNMVMGNKAGAKTSSDHVFAAPPPPPTQQQQQQLPQPAHEVSNLQPGRSIPPARRPLFDEDDDFAPADLSLSRGSKASRSVASSTAGSQRMMELQAQLPGSTFRNDGGFDFQPPSVPSVSVSSPQRTVAFDRSGVITMSPGLSGAGHISKTQRLSNFERMRQRKMQEAADRAEKKRTGREVAQAGGGDHQRLKWQPPKNDLPRQRNPQQKHAVSQWHPTPPKPHDEVKTFQVASNILSIKNALANLCLAGHHMSNEREAAMASLDLAVLKGRKENNAAPRFVILLSKGSATLAYRGLYLVAPNGEGTKIHGWGPKTLDPKSAVLSEFFRFNTGKKAFVEVGSKGTFGGTVDAVSLDPTSLKKRGYAA